MHVYCLMGLRYDDIRKGKTCDRGPVADTYLELKMRCLFYFALESEKNGHNVGTAVVPDKRFYFSPFYSLF